MQWKISVVLTVIPKPHTKSGDDYNRQHCEACETGVYMKKILITGVHKGLGAALAACFLDRGWSVFGISRVKPQSITDHAQFQFLTMDLLDISTIASKGAAFLQSAEFDLVVLNAGLLGRIQRFEQSTMKDIHRVMDLNVWANKVLLDVLLASPLPPKQVIAISSGAAKNGSSGWGPYSVSKAALNMLVRVLAGENPNTHFCSLAPGLVGTDMLNSIFDGPERPEFPADGLLRESKEAGLVQSPNEAAELVASIVDSLRQVESGSFQDVRALPFKI